MRPLAELLDRTNAVLFDFDGVLADSEPFHYEAYRVVFEGHGHRLDRDEYWRHWTDLGEGVEGEIRRHELALDPARILAEKRDLYESWVAGGRIPFYPEALDLLDAFAASAIPTAIASNTSADTIRVHFAAVGRKTPPVPVIGGTSALRKKPFPDIFLEGARVLEVDPAGCLVVEDARKGVEAAVAARMDVVVLRSDLNRAFEYPEAAAEIASLTDLAAALAASARR